MLKPFQFDDLARATLRDGVVFSWDTGLGKTWAAYLWPALKCGFTRTLGSTPGAYDYTLNGSTLIVAPGDLHLQIIAEGRERFGQDPTVIRGQDDFLSLSSVDAHGVRRVPPGYYLTTYTAMGGNGVPEPWRAERGLQELLLSLYPDDWLPRYQAVLDGLEYLIPITSSSRSMQIECTHPSLSFMVDELQTAMQAAISAAGLPEMHPQWLRDLGTLGHSPESALNCLSSHYSSLLQDGLGSYLLRASEPRDVRIRCLHAPELADLCAHTWDCVVVDEAVRIKGDKTAIAQGIHRLQPRFRMVLTATAIKNRLPDIFRLAWWAAGGRVREHALWPYADDPEDKGRFVEEFMVMERNLTRERDALANTGKRRQCVKATAQICNVHKLWKLLPTLVLRRRKDDCGEDIPPKVRQIIRCPMGQAQRGVYAHHLAGKYVDKNGKPAPGAKLQALRVAASAPHSALLTAVESSTDHPGSRPRSLHPYIPKVAATLDLIAQILERGEQVLIFGAFHHALDELENRLVQAGVPHLKLDGRTDQGRRGRMAAEFKARRVPVVLAGNCMSEGHSFPLCSNVIVTSFDWALDKLIQGINRAHRINSPGPVNVYSIIAEGTADRVLEQLLNEKADSANLALDGRLLTESSQEVNVAELLQEAAADYRRNDGKAVCEEILSATWPALRDRLRVSASVWGNPHAQPPVTPVTFDNPRFDWTPAAEKTNRFDFPGQPAAKRTTLTDLIAQVQEQSTTRTTLAELIRRLATRKP